MEYIRAFVYAVFYLLPFILLFEYLWTIIQIPFMLIHVFITIPIRALKIYYICLFSVCTTKIIMNQFQVLPLPILIMFSIMIFCFCFYLPSHQRQDPPEFELVERFDSIFSVLAVPAYLLMYYFDFHFISQPITWYMNLLDWIQHIPMLGSVFMFLLCAMSVAFILWWIFTIVAALFHAIMHLYQKMTAPAVTKAGSAAYAPEVPPEPDTNDALDDRVEAEFFALQHDKPFTSDFIGTINPYTNTIIENEADYQNYLLSFATEFAKEQAQRPSGEHEQYIEGLVNSTPPDGFDD